MSGPLTPRTTSLLREQGLEQWSATLAKAGMTSIGDIVQHHVTEANLEAIGINLLFHRKKLIKLSAERVGVTLPSPLVAPESSLGGNIDFNQQKPLPEEVASPTTFVPQGTGDRVSFHVLAVRSVGGSESGGSHLSEREHYVKVFLCSMQQHTIIPIIGEQHPPQKTRTSRGPYPTFVADSAILDTEPMNIETNFRRHCIAFELKEKRMLSDNRVIGIAVFPVTFFHSFTATTVRDEWYPMRGLEAESPITAHIRVRFTVPGGCPRAVDRAFHVNAVTMAARVLRVTVFDAEIVPDSRSVTGETFATDPPTTYVQLSLLKDDALDLDKKIRTPLVDRSLSPCFDKTFEYFAPTSAAKLLTIKLKEVHTISDATIGTVQIPLQFYLAQVDSNDVDKVFDAIDEHGEVRARLHLRLEIKQTSATEAGGNKVSYFRLSSSTAPAAKDGGSGSKERGLQQFEAVPTVLVDDPYRDIGQEESYNSDDDAPKGQ